MNESIADAGGVAIHRELEEMARTIRGDIVRMTGEAGSGHPGGALSATDIIVSLFFRVLRHDPKRPDWEERDRFVLSKGHACPALYAALAHAGYFSPEELISLRKLGSRLQGHPDKSRLPILEASSGSLGQGLSVGIGMVLAARIDGLSWRTYVFMGDGENQEGQVWEAAMFAGHHRIDSLTAIVDYNGLQLDGPIAEIVDLEPLADKWSACGWKAIEIDGHDFGQILEAFQEARGTRGRPTVIIARTVKGKGVSFMENNNEFHGVAPTPEEVRRALRELGLEE